MMLGAILDTATPLWNRIRSALRPDQRLVARETAIDNPWPPFFSAGNYRFSPLAASIWIAAALLCATCLFTMAATNLIFDPGRHITQLIGSHRLATALLLVIVQIIFALAIVAYENRSRRLKHLVSEAQHYLTCEIGGAGVGLWRWNAETRALCFTDRAKELLRLPPATDYDPAGVTGFIEPNDLAALRSAIAASSKSGTPFDANIRMAGRNGEPMRWLRCRGRLQTNDQGRILRIRGTLVDISDRMAMQTEIDRQRHSLIHLSRVGAIGKLSGTLAHEISQPLTAIMNNARAIERMLDHKPIDIQEVRAAISDIIEDDCRVGDVIRHLRALLRKEKAEYTPVDMTLLIHKVLGLVRKEMTLHRVKPVVAIAPHFPLVWGDDVQLQQLLLNLIMNAIDAIKLSRKGGGSLSITAYNEDGQFGSFHLCVSDTGGGISPELAEKLFEPFFSTKEDGLGLGLSISEAIVKGHNGTIRVENNDEGGASFHIILPAAREKAA
jgi:C4-dicarboxylate-specific signal transduction histidine kinase